MEDSRRIRTILYDDEVVEATELDLIHTPALQRLYELHQLGLTDRVFIDASHSRLHHVVGVLQQVENLVAAVTKNLKAIPDRRLKYRTPDGQNHEYPALALANYVEMRRRAVRLMGLLHDLTHSPYGHTLEDEIHLIKSKHDEPSRQAEAFYRLLCQFVGWVMRDSERLDSWADASCWVGRAPDRPEDALNQFLDRPEMSPPEPTPEFISFLGKGGASILTNESDARSISREPNCRTIEQFFRDLYFAMRGLLFLDVLHKETPDPKLIPKNEPYPFESVIEEILKKAGRPIRPEDRFHPHRDAFLLDIIGNTICADLLDYAKRDSHFTGLKLDYDEKRIVENFTLTSFWLPYKEDKHPFAGPSLRTAISIFAHRLRIEVPGELLNLLQIRFYVYQRVLFHPTKCIAGAMLGSALQLLRWKQLPAHLRYTGDVVFLHQVGEAARMVRDFLARFGTDPDALVKDLQADIFDIMDAMPTSGVMSAARQLVEDRGGDTVAALREDLEAAIRVLDRLASRRYYKPVFRLLPNASIGSLNQSASGIAAVFLDPDTRRRTERAIEDAADLPRGSVVIHCPIGDGPKKIANILILSRKNEKEECYRFREIGQIDRAIFQTHEDAVLAVEKMYASMWRLMVSVAPPHHANHKVINAAVGRILYEVLSNGDTSDSVPNDPLMVRELNDPTRSASKDGDSVTVRYRDGRTIALPVATFEQNMTAADPDWTQSFPDVTRAILLNQPVLQPPQVTDKSTSVELGRKTASRENRSKK